MSRRHQYGQTSYTFTVTYYGAAGIQAGTVPGAVVTVTPPAGVGGPITATVASSSTTDRPIPSATTQSDHRDLQITPPGGSWTSADNGTYDVSLGGSPITDSGRARRSRPARWAASWSRPATSRITKYGLIHNPKTHLWSGTIKLTNNGTSTFSGPIFVLFNLPAGAILENATGTYGGMPYLEVNVASLAAGATTSATVTFNTFVNAGSYSTSYYLVSLGS